MYDAAQWTVTYLGKHNEASQTLASEVVGLPIVECVTAASAEVMWSDADKMKEVHHLKSMRGTLQHFLKLMELKWHFELKEVMHRHNFLLQ